MAAYSGNYTRGGDPAAMFDEELRYLAPLQQAGKAAVDADFNDGAFSLVAQMRRIIENAIGDGSPDAGFEIVQSGTSTTNNFAIKGGDGTDDGAGRLFLAGHPAVLKSDVEYSGVFDARMNLVMPQITDLAATVLTDDTANWTVDEHAGNTLTPDVATPGTTFTVLSNTATTITITAGDMTVAAAISDFYRVELSTPSGGARSDEVYLDVFLDEVDENEDTNLVHTDLTPNQSAANRLVLRQFVRIKEGGTVPVGHVDVDGRQHYTIKLATLARLDADATVVTAMITDDRPTFSPGGGAIQLEDVSASTVIPSVTRIRVDDASLTDEGGGVARLLTGAGTTASLASRDIPFTLDVTAETGPTDIVVGTDIAAMSYVTGADRSQKAKITVPEDYSSGDIELHILYNASSAVASPNNVMRFQTEYDVVDVSTGAINTFGPFGSDFTTLETTAFERRLVLTIPAAQFSPGDAINVIFRRLGTQPSDDSSANLQIVKFSYQYLATLAVRGVSNGAWAFFDATGLTNTADGTIGTDIATTDFPTGADSNAKTDFPVPEQWDGVSDALFHVSFAMSAADPGPTNVVSLSIEGEFVDPVLGTITALATQLFDIVVPNDTDPHRTSVVYSVPASLLVKGGSMTIVVARLTGGGSNHTGDFQLIDLIRSIGITPSGGLSVATSRERYLNPPEVTQAAGSILAGGVPPAFAGDFELYDFVRGTAGGANQGDVHYQGRLGSDQTQITRITIPIRNGAAGTPDHRLKVYAEGSGASPVFDSGLVAPSPATRALGLVILTDADLSAQPTGEKRYFVVVECLVDNLEEVHVGRPYVREE